MADRFPIILNTSANQLQELASGDTLDVSGAGVKANLVDSLSVVGTGVSIVGVVTATTVNATTFVGALAGNSATATALQNARTIGGVSFDGTANINLPGVNATGNQDTSGNAATATALQNARTIGGVSFNGTANINLPGVNASGNQDTSGTAAVATNVTVSANNSTNETVYPVFVDGATGSQGAETDTGLTYNPSTGNLSATTFTGNTTGTIQTAAQPNITSVGTLSSLNVSGNVSIGGTLTYEDVTNIDSIGIVTARSGLVSPNADIDDFISVGSNIHLGNAGVVTATSFVGSGAALTGIDATSIKDSGGNVKIQAQASGAVHSGISTFNEINLGDSTGSGNNRLKFGVGNEFQIYHNSVHTMIENSTGALWLKSTHAGHIYLWTGGSHGIHLEGDNGHIIPSDDSAIDLGLTGTRFRAAYVDTYYGDGSNLTGISAGVPGISTTGLSGFNHVNVGGAMTCTGTIVNKIDATTENAVVIGYEANLLNTNTDGSVIIGHRAGYQNATGKGNNVFLGRYAGYAGGGTQGSSNAIVGDAAGMFMYDNASRNVALGVQAGYYYNNNDCVGVGGFSNWGRGEHNTAIGGYAYGPGNSMNTNYMTYPNNTSSNQWGDNNIVIGYQANLPNSDVDNYIVIGNSKNTNFVVGTLGVEVTAGVTTHAGSVVVGAGVSVVGIVTAANFLKADGSAVGGVASDSQENTLAGTNAGDAIQQYGERNCFFGFDAGTDLTTGSDNVFIGHRAGEDVTTANNNTIIGSLSGERLTTQYNNTFVGQGAGMEATSSNNVYIGYYSGKNHGSGSGFCIGIGNQSNYYNGSRIANIAIGYGALYGNFSHQKEFNLAIGHHALYTSRNDFNIGIGASVGGGSGDPAITGTRNILMGTYAGQNLTSGSDNTIIGDRAGDLIESGTNCIIIGHDADASSTTVSNEVTIGDANINHVRVPGIGVSFSEGGAVISGIVTATNFVKADGSAVGGVSSDADSNTLGGTGAGNNLASGANRNTFFGREAGETTSTGDDNTAVGAFALKSNGTGSNNVAVGYVAQYYNTGSNCIAIGARSLYRGTGSSNIGIGYYTGDSLTSGNENILIGLYTGQAFTTGATNVAVGHDALSSTIDANDNVAIGKNAMSEGDAGNGNVAVGYQSLMFSTGSSNTALGNSALRNSTTGGSNVAIGYQAMQNNNTGSHNIAIGVETLYAAGSKHHNICLGREAGHDLATGYHNIIMGYQCADNKTSGDNCIILGKQADPSSATVSNEITLGNSDITRFRIPGTDFEVQKNSTSNHMILLGTTNSSTDAWSGTRQGIKLVGNQPLMYLVDYDNTTGDDAYVGHAGGALYVAKRGGKLAFQTAASGGSTNNRWTIESDGHFLPAANNTYDIGNSSNRVRNLYTNDLNLSNEGSKNDVDGTWGNYTIQEGENDLFLINKRNGKKYKFNLTEVS